jgi:photosystem II stability/assembly factor-like uncharacterized protein
MVFSKSNSKLVLAIVLLLGFAGSLTAQQWVQLGPDGGDVRTLTRDPFASDRILLTTSAGLVYESQNGGGSWSRMAHVGGSDYVLDAMIFHPTRQGIIYAGAWSVEETSTGDVFRSLDNGRTWKAFKEMHGESVRALAMAPSDPKVLVAGTLNGVFRSMDGGEHWSQISPAGHADIRNVESIAIDPVNPDIIYAGTWHLPWKTTDGGATWTNIKNGIVDDSDVFSIIVDPKAPSIVYASACSGIYKSESAGAQFHKAQGIPKTARRTRVLQQDPINENIVYAGTTEGLWKTTDGGYSWNRMTGSNIIVNDVLIDPANHDNVMLATDRSGVLATSNGGQTFVASNRGFAHRQVASLLIDQKDSTKLYAGLINDKEFGGVFTSKDSGRSWQQMSSGLNGLDIFTLRQTPAGDLLAGTNHGIYRYKPAGSEFRWMEMESPVVKVIEVKTASKSKKKLPARTVRTSSITARVNDLELGSKEWFAATSSGLFLSRDAGKSWQGGPVQGEADFIQVQSLEQMAAAVSRRALFVSQDEGATWQRAALPQNVTGLHGVALDKAYNIYIATREGGYRSADNGRTWQFLAALPAYSLTSIVYDESSDRLLATSKLTTELFVSSDGGNKWHSADSGFPLRNVRAAGGRIFATTAFDGLVAQPEAGEAVAVSAGGRGSQK